MVVGAQYLLYFGGLRVAMISQMKVWVSTSTFIWRFSSWQALAPDSRTWDCRLQSF